MHPELNILFVRCLVVNEKCRLVTIIDHSVLPDDIFKRNDVRYCVFAEPDRAFIAIYCCPMVNTQLNQLKEAAYGSDLSDSAEYEEDSHFQLHFA